MTKLNAYRAAKEFAVDYRGLVRCLVAAGHEVKKGSTFTLREIYVALSGDFKAERTREMRERADRMALDRKEREGDLMPTAGVQKLMSECFLPIRQRFLALPSEMAHRTNPVDPPFAQRALQGWVDEALRLIRENILKPRTK